MALKSETLDPKAYRAIEEIVGLENISEEPAILDGYVFQFSNEALYGDPFGPRPLAVVLPGNTEEIQAVVRICNEYKVQYKAFSTGFGSWGSCGDKPAVSIDLRRMGRILEIDERNMFAVIEPYVNFAELSYELMKKGLRCWSVGAGPGCSVLANATSAWGMGTTSVSAGFGGRNLLAVEWVLPDGELLKLGTLGLGSGWFSGDGPGLSLLSIARGYAGGMGSIGVFTKAAIKVVPWYGPPTLDAPGEAPVYIPKLPECFRMYTIAFDSRENMYEAMRLTAEEDLQYAGSRRGPYTMARGVAKSNKELASIWATGYYQKKFSNSLSYCMDASSDREMEYREKCLRAIVGETGGEIIIEDERGQSARFVHTFIGAGATKSTFSTGRFGSGPNAEESLDTVSRAHDLGLGIKQEAADKGAILDDGDSTWVSVLEPSAHMETVYRYDPCDPESVKGAAELSQKAGEILVENKLDDSSYHYYAGPGKPHYWWDFVGPKCLNYHIWIGKIKKAIDPNSACESSWYPAAVD